MVWALCSVLKLQLDAKAVIAKCLEKSVVCLSAKNKVRLLPALNIPQDQLEKAIAIVAEAIERVSGKIILRITFINII